MAKLKCLIWVLQFQLIGACDLHGRKGAGAVADRSPFATRPQMQRKGEVERLSLGTDVKSSETLSLSPVSPVSFKKATPPHTSPIVL